jgi:hypothetical protein
MGTGRLFGFGAFASTAWLLAAPVPGGCGPVGGGTGGAGPESVCGNGIWESGEQCDGNSRTCESWSEYARGGAATCKSDCTWDSSQCRRTVCGDGVIEGIESCEGDTFLEGADLNCSRFSEFYIAGKVSCNELCHYDTSACVTRICGNGKLDTTEPCEGGEFSHGSDRCAALDAAKYSGGTLRCSASCELDTSACATVVCGDGKVDGYEECDGTNLGNAQSCAGLEAGFAGGVLTCDADCRYDTSSCTLPVCGDGAIQGYESCEGTNLGADAGKGCSDFTYGMSVFFVPTPYQPGPLRCSPSSCQLDLSQCRPQPGCYLRNNCGPLPTTPCAPTIYCVP